MADKFLTLAGLKDASSTKSPKGGVSTIIQFDALEKALKSYEAIEEHEMNERRDALDEVIKRANEAIKSKTAKSADRDLQKYLDNVLKAATTERKKIESDLTKFGMQKVKRLDIFMYGWKEKEKPMENRQVHIEFESKPKPKILLKGVISKGVMQFNDLELPPSGSIHVKAFSNQGAKDQAEGTKPYDLPKKDVVRFEIIQNSKEEKEKATSEEEAVKKLGVTGKAGVDFEIKGVKVNLGSEVTHEGTEKKNAKTKEREFTVTLPGEALAIKMI
jgi:hypothetical protein